MKSGHQFFRQYQPERWRGKQQAGEKRQQQNAAGAHQGFERMFHAALIFC